MKYLIQLFLIVLTLAYSHTPRASVDFTPSEIGQFHRLRFSHSPYSFEINIFVSDDIMWVDFIRIYVENENGYDRILGTSFLQDVYTYIDPITSKPSILLDFKDNSLLVIAQDMSEVKFSSPFHKGHLRMEFDLLTVTPRQYHSRFPTGTEPSPIWVVDTKSSIHRRPEEKRGWDPRELKLHLEDIGKFGRCRTLVMTKELTP